MTLEFLRPETPADAVLARRDRPGAVFVAGGSDITPFLTGRSACAVSLERLPLREIRETAERLEIGALCPLQALVDAPLQNPYFAALGRAARHVNNRHIRNVATAGGNLASGKSSADLVPLLLAQRATLRCLCDDLAERTLAVPDYLGLDPRPLILAITVDAPPPGTLAACRAFTRTANDISLVNVALTARIAAGRIAEAAVAAGCVAKHPILLPEAAAALAGLAVDDAAAQEAALRNAVDASVAPADDHRASAWYRRQLVVALLLECLDEMAATTKGGR